ncbi:acetyl-CoA acetyltransferase [Tardibacter chloracetimidivorans]|uniref:Acetyl-CoA acetyltransferase n=1 Tax=Tardibacter chloracetimidivorans TaxID=1921510 RepID=A0A1L3ZWC3_9SPHN|nr:acetyl-CoA C-acetyltransferase [Tardibacter chloracetimidivorans]API59910.1 acetyl-CoA acetyltransferase [Tardibacter chloracetimidivorans]
MPEAYILSAVRTATGKRNGRLSGLHPALLAGRMLDALVARSGADPAAIGDVILGCVGQVGEQASNIGRNAVLSSSLPESVPGTTVERQCGSSQQALHFAAQAVMSGAQDVVIAGGVESMSRIPMMSTTTLAAKAGMGGPSNPAREARYPGIQFSQFSGAEAIARKFGLDKDMLDAFALESHLRAASATARDAFREEIFPVTLDDGTIHDEDEGIRKDATLDGIAGVKLILPDGRLTAATSSQISDGASGVLVVNEAGLKRLGGKPLARMHHMTVVGGDPVVMLESPIAGTQRALARTGMRIEDIDLYEVNEAFSAIPLAWLQAIGADPARTNIHGGAIALGHPLGASGTRIFATLVHALRSTGKRYGLQTMCEGGGMANVTIVERL